MPRLGKTSRKDWYLGTQASALMVAETQKGMNNLFFMSTVDSTKSNGLFNGGKGNFTQTLKTPPSNSKDNEVLQQIAWGGCRNSVIIKAFKNQTG